MTGRHEFVPIHNPSQTDCEEVSNYNYVAQLKAHHDAAISGWDKPSGIHKLEKPAKPAIVSPRDLALAALTSLKIPRLKL